MLILIDNDVKVIVEKEKENQNGRIIRKYGHNST